MSVRGRLVLAAAYLLATVVVALEIPLALSVGRRADSEFRATVLGRAALLAARASDVVARANTVPRAAPPAGLRGLVADTTRTTDDRILVVDGSGRVLADSTGDAAAGTAYATSERPELRSALRGRVDSRTRFSETLGVELLLVTVPVVENDRVVGAVRVSTSTAAVSERVHGSWFRLALIGLAVVAAGLAVAWILATRLVRPVRRLADAADRLGRGDLAVRAPPEGPAELAGLARSFNQMAGALAATVAAQREFVANASHQLRTPLTGLKLRLEGIKSAGGPAAAEAAKAEREVDRLSGLADDLLELARASAPEATGKTIDLAKVARDAVERWRGQARASGRQVDLVTDGVALVWASEIDLGHVLDNLIENAVRYTPPGTEIRVEAGERPAGAVLAVGDTGPGIDSADRPRVFERFYRGSDGRRSGSGTGLGLAIVDELVGRWGGEVRLVEGPGTRIEATFPRAPTVS